MINHTQDILIGQGDNAPDPVWLLPFNPAGSLITIDVKWYQGGLLHITSNDDLVAETVAGVDGGAATGRVTWHISTTQSALMPLGASSRYILRRHVISSDPQAEVRIYAAGTISTTNTPVDPSLVSIAITGAQGVPGTSAYGIALEHGFSGTEIEWLASLRGVVQSVNGQSVANVVLGAHDVETYTQTEITALDNTAVAAAEAYASALFGGLTIPNIAGLVSALASKALASDLTAHVADHANPHAVTKAQVGLGNAENTADADKGISTATAAALVLKAAQSDFLAFQSAMTTALAGKATPADITAAIAVLTNGSHAELDTFLEIFNRFLSDESTASALNAVVATKAAAADLTAHVADHTNPHAVTKAQVGLGNVANTAPADLPVSTAGAAALATATLPLTNLSPAARAVVTASDVAAVFIYDTTKDSDGGKWRKRVNGTSWMREPLNTTTADFQRGARRDFPSRALIVFRMIETNQQFAIYDLDSPSCDLWRSMYLAFNTQSPATPGCLTACNGIIGLGFAPSGWNGYGGTGPHAVDLVSDVVCKGWASSLYAGAVSGIATYTIQALFNLSASDHYLSKITTLPNTLINSIDAIVLPNTPKNPRRRGLPNPTIVVGTAGGLSILRSDGAVINGANAVGFTGVSFMSDGRLVATSDTYGGVYVLKPEDYLIPGFTVGSPSPSGNNGVTEAFVKATKRGFASAGGGDFQLRLSIAALLLSTSMTAIVADTFNTGWMGPNTKLALAESSKDLSTLTGGTVTDRSPAGNNAAVNGTITRSLVASGADVAAYGGFSAANYLEVPANSALDFGTGDFCAMAWVSAVPDSYNTVFCYGNGVAGSNAGWVLLFYGTYVFVSIGSQAAAFSFNLDTSVLNHVAFVRRGAYVELYVNGKRIDSVYIGSANPSCSGATLRIGNEANCSSNEQGNPAWLLSGKLAIPRIAAFGPTAAQIAAVYASELPLFQQNAKALLPSANVKALAYDAETALLAVATDAGTAQFDGLQNVGTISCLGTGLSGSDNHKRVTTIGGVTVIGTANGVDVFEPTLRLREELLDKGVASEYDPVRGDYRAVTVDATPTDIAQIVIPEGSSFRIELAVSGMSADNSGTVHLGDTIEALINRPVGGGVVVTVLSSSSVVALHASSTSTVAPQVTGLAGTNVLWHCASRLFDIAEAA